MKKIFVGLVASLGTAGTIVGLSLVACIPFTVLWNWLMPMIFGLIKIKLWHGFGLIALSGILFKD